MDALTQAKTGVEVERLIGEALEKATQGDWHWNEDDNMYPSPRDYTKGLYPEAIIETDSGVYGPREGDREYIVAVQPANIRQLLAALAAQRAEAVRMREENEKLRADAERAERIHADKVSLARGAAKFSAWQDFACRFTYSQRKHISNLLAHEWTICAIEIQSKYGTRNGAVPDRIEGSVSIEKALEAVAALSPSQGGPNV